MRPLYCFGALATLFAACALAGCGRRPPPVPVQRAFYSWRTAFHLSAAEERMLAESGAGRLYLRLLDVDASGPQGAPALVARVAVPAGARLPAGVQLVPVVFVREAALHGLAAAATSALAGQLWSEAQRLSTALGAPLAGLQLDCDWTDSSRETFFALLRAVRQRAALVPLSATIRLHQIKYRERTGVPPVERGMLMFYNMGELGSPEAPSIYDPARAGAYLERLADYPLPLDLALPLYSWTVQLRDGRPVGLLQSTDPAELASVEFLRPAGDDRYTATRVAFLHGHLLREGDVLQGEVTTPERALAAAQQIAQKLPAAPGGRTVALFELSERTLARHGLAGVEQVFRALR